MLSSYPNLDESLIVENDLPTFNNTDDEIVIYSDGNLIDSLFYDMDWGEKGKSLERIDLAGETNSEDNWTITLSEEGGTPGEMNSIDRSYVDLAVSEVKLNDTDLEIYIENLGDENAPNTSLKISENSITLHEDILNINDSVTKHIVKLSELNKDSEDNFNLVIFLYNEEDIINDNDTLVFSKEKEYDEKVLLINEIMFDVGDEQEEYIEIYNNSSESINLNGFSVADETMKGNNEKSYIEEDVIIESGNFIVLATSSLKKFQVTAIILSENFALNNSGDQIYLYDPSGKEIDFVEYTASWHDANGDTKNISLEKTEKSALSNEKSNWKSCDDEEGGTPGKENSEKPIIYDIELINSTLTENELSIELKNNTRIKVDDVTVNILENEVQITSKNINSIAAMSKENIDFKFSELGKSYEDNFNLTIIATHPLDTININDTLYVTKRKNISAGTLLINEIMFDISEGNSEYIELYNTTNESINLLGFGIADETMKNKNEIAKVENDITIEPLSYAVLSYDTLFSNFSEIDFTPGIIDEVTLNNSGDEVFLYDTRGNIIDSLIYSSDWHESYLTNTKDRSLEKISPELETNQKSNWRTSSSNSGGTPGKVNSMVQDTTISDNINITPNPFSVSSSSFEYCTITYKNPFDAALLDITIFKPNGQQISVISKSEYITTTGQVNWNGRTEEGDLLPIGPYVVLLEFTDQDSGEYKSFKKVIVLAD